MGVEASISSKSRLSLVGYFDGLSTWSQAGNRADRSAHRRQWSSLFFALTTAFMDRKAAEVGCRSCLSKADILRCPARGSALGQLSTPTLSASTFRAAPGGGVWLRQEPL